MITADRNKQSTFCLLLELLDYWTAVAADCLFFSRCSRHIKRLRQHDIKVETHQTRMLPKRSSCNRNGGIRHSAKLTVDLGIEFYYDKDTSVDCILDYT